MEKKKLPKPILAEGETTGHAHRLDGDVDVYELSNGLREFLLKEETNLVHEEHGTIKLEPGKKVSGIVQEYDHFAEEARKVVD